MHKINASRYLMMFWQAYELGTNCQKARYHLSGVYHFDENHPVDVASLQQAIKSLVVANVNLRSDFIKEKSGLAQRIHTDIGAELAIVQVGSEAEEQAQIEQATNRLFDLTQAPLCRFVLLQRQDCQRETLVCVFHHIIMDGKHFDATIAELFQYYETHETVSVDDTAAIEALENYLAVESERIAKADIDYWYQQVQDAPESIDLPYASKKIDKAQAKTQTRQYQLDVETYAALQTYSQSSGHSIFNIIKTAWALLISRYSRQSAVVISHPLLVAKDPLLKGCYINSNLYAYREVGSFEDQLNAFVFDETLKQNRFAPILSVLENLYDQGYTQSAADLMRVGVTQTDLRQAPVDYVTAAVTPNVVDSELALEYDINDSTVVFQINLLEGLLSDGLSGQVGYHFAYLLLAVLSQPQQNTAEIGVVPTAERQQILGSFNQTEVAYPNDHCWIDCFQETVALYPDHIAVVDEASALTYLELDGKANALAKQLMAKGVQAESRVAIFLPASIDMIISCLAIWKAGGAYVPIAKNYPQERIDYIVSDSGASVILTHQALMAQLAHWHNVDLIDVDQASLDGCVLERPVERSSKDLAYVIYTSGSTGQPKGVQIQQQSLMNFCCWAVDEYALNTADRVAQYSNVGFDASIEEIFPSLMVGATLDILPESIKLDLLALCDHFNRHGVTWASFPTQFFEQWSGRANVPSLKTVVIGGDKLKQCQPVPYRVVNTYGPTEATVEVTAFTVDQRYDNIPIGKPIANTQVVILDQHLQPVPIGVAGELCVAGDGLARGYLNRSDLTAEVFVEHKALGKRLYRTGDLARWRPDGNIEFLGRIDFQVKIRGYRIELGEIDARLMEIEGIDDGVVLALDDEQGNKFLCGYYSAPEALDVQAIHESLKAHLPDYMVPDIWVYLETLPLTPNGKVDRKSLPKPDMSAMQVEYCAPRTEAEEILVQAFSKVLNLEQVGVYDDFFALGGNSLKAVALSAHLAEQGYEVKVADIFAAKTVEALAEQLHQGEAFEAIQVAPKAKHYPTSLSQRNMFITDQLGDVGTTYNIPMRLDLKGALDVTKLEQAIQALIIRHDNFRTCFELVDGEPVQIIQAEMPFTLEQQKATQKTIDKLTIDFVQPFDLSQTPLFRFKLLTLSKSHHVLLFDIHHIIFDGGSDPIFMQELMQLYQGETLEPLTLQYKDFAVWQKAYRETEAYQEQVDYWLNEYAEEAPTLELPLDHPRSQNWDYQGQTVSHTLTPELSAQLSQLAKTLGISEYSLYCGVFAILLSKYCRQPDVVIGTAVSGRTRPEIQSMLGMFVNSLPLRQQIDSQLSIAEQLQRTHQKTVGLLSHQDYSIDALLDQLQLPKSQGRMPLMDVFFNYIVADASVTSGLLSEANIINSGIAKFDLTLNCLSETDTLTLALEYCQSLFTAETIARMLRHYHYLLEQVVVDQQQSIATLELVLQDERQQILNDFNQTYADYPRDKTLVDCFEMAVEQYADQVALVYQGQSLTYRELDQRANQLAHYLQQQGAGPNQLVGVLLDRGPEIVISMLAVLKTGAAYVPIDTIYPQERVQMILEDAGVICVLSTAAVGMDIDPAITVLDVLHDDIAEQPTSALKIPVKPSQLLCLIYTSGSTGRPKGVMLDHANLVDFCHWYRQARNIQSGDAIAVHASYGFDAAMMGTYPVFFAGGVSHIIPEAMRLSLAELHMYFMQQKIRGCFFTTQLGEQYMQHYDNTELHFLDVGGERLKEFVKRQYQLWNVYGPTETTIYASQYPVEQVMHNYPIGKPLANVQITIVSPDMQLCPIGVAGELCIAGPGVSQGYYQREALTTAAFIPNPFAVEGDQRIVKPTLYKTGDLARWLPDGNIEFLGRVDFQVKIRGYRIELGEIDVRLVDVEGVDAGIVLALEDEQGNKFLCAYYAAIDPIAREVFQKALQAHLPDYMVPELYVHLSELPLTSNGKIDRKALPKPDVSAMQVEYCAPRTEAEEILAQAFSQVLNIEQVGVYDNFFALGGNSLKAVALSAHLAEQGYEVKVADIFAAKTVEALAEQLHQGKAFEAIQVAPKAKHYPTSLSQRNMFITDQLGDVGTTYNIPMRLDLKGALDVTKLEQAIQALITRHDNFRTRFELVGGEPVQIIQTDMSFILEQQKATKTTIDKLAMDFVQPFDLNQAPLFRFKLLTLSKTHHVLLFDIHHIIFDGGSDPVFMQELIQLYQGETLKPLTLQYKDFAVWQKAYRETEAYQEQVDYWLNEYTEEAPTLELPLDHPRSQNWDYQGQTVSHTLTPELSTQLSQLAKTLGISEYSLYCGVFAILLSKYCRQPDVVIGTAVSGRTRPEIQSMLGMFVNSLPLRQQVDSQLSIAEQLQQTHQKTLGLLSHQDYSIDALLDRLQLPKSQGRMPLMDVFFNYIAADVSATSGFLNEVDSIDSGIAKFDLTLNCLLETKGLTLTLEYRSSLFKTGTIERLLQHYRYLLEQVVGNQKQTVSNLELVLADERQQLLHDFNQTQVVYPRHGGLLQWFEQVAKTHAQHIAVVFEHDQINYEDLNQRANQLAHTLLSQGVKKGDIVGLCFEACIDMITSMLAVLKAGAAFLPMAADTPVQRIEYMLENSGSAVVITQSPLQSLFETTEVALVLSDQWRGADYPTTAPVQATSANDVAYIIYTSGSTGQPKGVKIALASLENLSHWAIGAYELKSGVACSKYASFAFDASIMEVFPSLLSGATLHIIPKALRLDLDNLARYFREHALYFAFLPTPVAEHFIQHDLPALRHLMVGGDKLRQVKPVPYCIHNAYGPTEDTVQSTDYIVQGQLANIPIGKPCANHRVYVLDADLNVVPIGIPGELCVAGAGLALGYCNRDDLTKKAFIEHQALGERIYRTGDLVRWLPDGNLEFLGRIDFQVKIRGYRIELGEIDARLLDIDGIDNGVVLALDDTNGNKFLCAYYAAKVPIARETLQQALKAHLPAYMVPELYVHLPELPLTPNGKIDRKALPKPDMSALQVEYCAPRTDQEEILAQAFAQVLNLERAGVYDDFFALGGNSLKAVALSAHLAEQDYEVKVADIFAAKTVEALAEQLHQGEAFEAIQVAPKAKHYPTSLPQRNMFITDQLGDVGTTYNIPMRLDLKGVLDITTLEQAIQTLIARHDNFRTRFELVDGEPVQIIQADMPFTLEQQKATKKTIDKLAIDFVQAFDLSQAPLFRFKLLTLSKTHHVLLFDIHHIIFDGGSDPVFMQELIQLYQGETLEPLTLQYKDFAVWQKAYRETAAYQEQVDYWLNEYAEEAPTLELPLDHPRSQNWDYQGQTVSHTLTPELSAQLSQLAKTLGISNYSLYLGVFAILLSKYCRQPDVVIGTAVSGRTRPEIQSMLGMFVNSLPLRQQIDSQLSITEQLQRTHQKTVGLLSHQDYSIDALLDQLQLPKSQGRMPLMDVFFNYIVAGTAQEQDVQIAVDTIDSDIAKFDLTLSCLSEADTLTLAMEYRQSLFTAETIERMLRHYQHLLEQIVTDQQRSVAELELTLAAERQQILNDFNQTNVDHNIDCCWIEIFEQTVAKHPNHIAVVAQDKFISYSELNAKANQLARKLVELNIQAESIVAIFLPPSIDLIVGFLAVWKAGGAYLPIATNYPQERIDYLLKDSQASVLLTTCDLLDSISHLGLAALPLSLDGFSFSAFDDKNLAGIRRTSNNLAYVIYTSGSTGQPKGVLIEQRSLVNFTLWCQRVYLLTPDDKVGQYANVSFDGSLEEIFPTLMAGAALYMLPAEIKLDLPAFKTYFAEHHITIGSLPTAIYEQWVGALNIPSLRILMIGGDKAKQYQAVPYQVFNSYGPTEATVNAASFVIDRYYDNIPIGWPLDNTRIYILDQDLQLVPIGVAGELCIAGDGLARGYLNRDDLTEKVFIHHESLGERIYRTGDLARWLPDGTLECLGRIDNQVKIRGYRIELGEIEARLVEVDAVDDGVVLALDDEQGNKFLCGYYSAPEVLDVQVIRQSLKAHLPEYMVPDIWVYLEKLPLTPNGKVDRKALPKPDMSALQVEYCAPRTDQEDILARAFAQVLNIEQVGVYDDFFALGGNSLKAVALSAHLAEQGYEVKVADIFAAKTVEALAEQLHQGEAFEAIQVAPEAEHYPLSLSQRNMFITNQLGDIGTTYNMPSPIEIKGNLDREQLGQALDQLVERHEVLRTAFKLVEGEPVQVIDDQVVVRKAYAKVSVEEIEREVENFVEAFDLEQAPLFRIKLLEINRQHHVLLLDFHHIIFDGVSAPIFFSELWQLYQGKTLEPLTLQYKDFAAWQTAFRQSAAYQEQEAYWLHEYAEAAPVMELPLDFPRQNQWDYQGHTIEQVLPEALTQKLDQLVQELEISHYSLFLGAFILLLSKYCRQEDLVIGTAVSGRSRPEVQTMLGMFVNSLPLRQQIDRKASLAETLQQTHQKTIGLLAHQDYSIDELLNHLGLEKSIGRMPLLDVFYNFLEDGAPVVIDGLALSARPYEDEIAKFDLCLNGLAGENGVSLFLTYRTALYRPETIERMLGHLQVILQQMVECHTATVSSLALVSPAERQQLVHDFNQTDTNYPNHGGLLQRFEQIAKRHADLSAVVCGEVSLSYQQLDQRANQLAHALIAKGVGVGDIVGVCFEPCVDMVVALMAVLKAGAAFLPMATNTPEQRIAYMLKDSSSRVVVTQSHLLKSFTPYPVDVFAVDDSEALVDFASSAPAIHISPNDLAYVIYTSGSTGKPKGVLIEHSALENLINWCQVTYELEPDVACSKYASLAFDASIVEVLPCLFSAACLHVIPSDLRLDLAGLAHYFQMHDIHYAFLPTPVAEQFMQYDVPALKHLCVAGDKLRQVKPVNYCIHNGYGPTENTVYSTDYVVTETVANIPIGKPIANHRAYILDADLNLLPIGVPGELCMAGAGLARGYLNRDEQTARAFIHHEGLGERLYRTGDLARWLPDGNLEFLGRIDFQVKIRGYRIELGEIEARLVELEGVEDGAVLALDDPQGNKFLCGYYSGDASLTPESLQAALRVNLSDYMVPEVWVYLDKMPLTTNGKVDRKGLPEPDMSALGQAKYVAPETELERQLAVLWADSLNMDIEKVGIHDDFFKMGGNSIKAIGLISNAQTKGLKLSINDLFQHSSIADMVANLDIQAFDFNARLEQMKTAYLEAQGQEEPVELKQAMQTAETKTAELIEALAEKALTATRVYDSIAVTGATGFLGSHVVKYLLDQQQAVVALVRGESHEKAKARLLAKLGYYFGEAEVQELEQSGLLSVYASDLTQANLGLTKADYQALVAGIDGIIHTAANVSHYGEYETFHRDNVEATEHCLALAQAAKVKSFQFISTRSTCEDGDIEGCDYQVYCEADIPSVENMESVYIRSKCAAEHAVIAARETGLKTVIHRVGNLVFHSKSYKAQENIEDNGFYQTLKAPLNLGYVLEDFQLEMSCVDKTAEAVCRIAAVPALDNSTYHVYSPNIVNLPQLLQSDSLSLSLDILDFPHYIDRIKADYASGVLSPYLQPLLLHYGWLDDAKTTTQFSVKLDYTRHVLEQIGFEWGDISAESLSQYIQAAFKTRSAFLQTNPLLQGVDAHAIDELAQRAQLVAVSEQDCVITEGQVSQAFYLSETGVMNVTVRSPGGWEGTVELLGPGDYIGISALLNPHGHYRSTAEVVFGEAAFYRFNAETLVWLKSHYPQVVFNLLNQEASKKLNLSKLLVMMS